MSRGSQNQIQTFAQMKYNKGNNATYDNIGSYNPNKMDFFYNETLPESNHKFQKNEPISMYSSVVMGGGSGFEVPISLKMQHEYDKLKKTNDELIETNKKLKNLLNLIYRKIQILEKVFKTHTPIEEMEDSIKTFFEKNPHLVSQNDDE